MDFDATIRQFSEQLPAKKTLCATEEATKHSLILPFIQMLGYDIFNPIEVVPEVDCDLKRSGEKIDYIIENNGAHLMLIECKHWKQKLSQHTLQLSAYFAASNARIGILTNGIEYRFFTDLEKPNLMDDAPFLVVDMEHLSDEAVEWLLLFKKDTFNAIDIANNALEKCRFEKLRAAVEKEFTDPSADFVKYFAKRISITTSGKVLEQTKSLLIKAIRETTNFAPEQVVPAKQSDNTALSVVQDIVKGVLPSQRITWVDNQQYSTIRLDGSEWSPICRIKFTDRAKWISISHYNSETDKVSQGEKHPLTTLSDIRTYSDEILLVVRQMMKWKSHQAFNTSCS